MNSIQLENYEAMYFLSYLGECLEQQEHHDDLKNFSIAISPDNSSILIPHVGEFHWNHGGNEFLITYFEEGGVVSGPDGPTYYRRLTIKHSSLPLLRAFVTEGLTCTKKLESGKIKVVFSNAKGYWTNTSSIYAQPFEGVYLPDDIKQGIVEHIDSFLASKDRYIRFGRAYKLGFLLTGVPGAGKTSLAKSIALKYKRTVYVLSFSKHLTDDALIELVNEIKDNSILLIEDIDAFFLDRQAQDINVSFSALLNVLDGTSVKGNGTITFLTANNPDRLDPALIRPGRVDRIVKFHYPRKKEIAAAFADIADGLKFEAFYDKIKGVRITMSAIIDFLFHNPSTYLDRVDVLLDQAQTMQEIVNDKTDKLFN